MAAYCSQCGEKRVDRDDWKLRHIAGETFSELVNVEHSKLWQTLRRLVARPGQLTTEYWSGRRKGFIGPVKLYLVTFAVSLVLYSIHQPTAVYDVRTLAAADPGGKFSQSLEKSASQRGMTTPLFAQEVNARWQSYISMSQLAYPLFVALALKLLFRRRGLYFAEHLIFSLHILACVFLSFVVLWPAYFLFGAGGHGTITQFSGAYFAIAAVSTVWLLAYLILAVRRAYAEGWIVASLKSIVIFLVYFVTSALFVSATLLVAVSRARGAG